MKPPIAIEDCQTLEGKEIIYKVEETAFNFGKEIEAVVVGCDFDIGITIMTRDKKEYLGCYHRPSSPDFLPGAGQEERSEEIFWKKVAGILSGTVVIDARTCRKHVLSRSTHPSADNCPFSQ